MSINTKFCLSTFGRAVNMDLTGDKTPQGLMLIATKTPNLQQRQLELRDENGPFYLHTRASMWPQEGDILPVDGMKSDP